MSNTFVIEEKPANQVAQLDFSYLEANNFMIMTTTKIDILVVGLGGTGSWVASGAARIARTLLELGKDVRLKFIDPDIVERGNVLRQNFCYAEEGLYKATTLAARFGAAWGLDIEAHNEMFSSERHLGMVSANQLTLLVGCVDNAAARQEIATSLARNSVYREMPNNHNRANVLELQPPRVLWLDAGNSTDSGQVLLGTHNNPEAVEIKRAFDKLPGYCFALPSPALQAPTLLIPRPEEVPDAVSNMSCEQIALLNAQSLMVNQRIAAEVSDYMLRLLVSNNLKRWQTFIDLPSGVTKSSYITPASVKKVLMEA